MNQRTHVIHTTIMLFFLCLIFITLDFNSVNTNALLPKLTEDFQYDLWKKDAIRNENLAVNVSSFKNGLLKYENIWFKKKHALDWWQKEVIYQIFPRSFKDTNGNGMGDLQGIIQSIPYLKDLGVGAIWIAPIYPSPGIDYGFDVSDYKQIDKIFGSMDDFDELVRKLHENGIKLILDYVPNHTSDEHEWFIKSVQKIEPYTDYYVWADPKYKNGTKQPPNNWLSMLGDSIWTWNEERQQYYLHQCINKQGDLNFRNKKVREEMKDVLRYWIEKGVDGFRIDAVAYLYERADLKDLPPDYKYENITLKVDGYTKNLEETFDVVKSWRSLLDEYKRKDGKTRCMMVESYETMVTQLKYYGTSKQPGAHFPINPYLMFVNHATASDFIELISVWLKMVTSKRWTNWMLGNHDVTRCATTNGEEMIDALHMIQMLLPGTAITYYGDELGMTSTYLRNDQIYDLYVKVYGQMYSRDRVRTPFQWDSTAQAGFSTKTKTWLPVNPNYVTVNVKDQNNAIRSHLKIYKELVKLRKLDVFRWGQLSLYEISKYVFGFSRHKGIKVFFIVVNLGNEMENINLKDVKKTLPSKMKVRVVSSFAEQNKGDIISIKSFTLRPNAALVLES